MGPFREPLREPLIEPLRATQHAQVLSKVGLRLTVLPAASLLSVVKTGGSNKNPKHATLEFDQDFSDMQVVCVCVRLCVWWVWVWVWVWVFAYLSLELRHSGVGGQVTSTDIK
jgi:hypothetical protein